MILVSKFPFTVNLVCFGSLPCSECFYMGLTLVCCSLKKSIIQIQIPNLERMEKKSHLVEFPLLNLHSHV